MFVGEDMMHTKTCGPILSPNIVHSHYFGNLVCLHVVQDRLQAKSTSRMAFHQEREDDKDMGSIYTCLEIKAKEISNVVLTEKGGRRSFGSSHRGGGLNQVRAHLGFQDQSVIKLVTRARPGSVFDDPHMDGKLIR